MIMINDNMMNQKFDQDLDNQSVGDNFISNQCLVKLKIRLD